VTIPVELNTDEGKKQFRKTVQLDTKALGLKHGKLTLSIEKGRVVARDRDPGA